jgi:23S rRNA (guanosine2251-2'-O)-methyltransferase
MAGNSQRRGRRLTPKAGAPKGSGGKNKDSLAGRGRTLPADERPWHKGYSGTEKLPQRTAWKQDKERRAAAEDGRAPKIGQPGSKDTTWGKGGGRGVPASRGGAAGRGGRPTAGRTGPRVAPGRKSNPSKDTPELLVGRNPGIANLEISRAELDRMTGGVLHQGVGLQVPPFAYEQFEDLVAASLEQQAPLLVALDGVTDPRNLGAVIRSAAAFGAQGVFVPERRAAGITATAWRTSAGAAARVPVAQVTNLTRSLKACRDAGFMVVGLDADGDTDLYDLEAAVGPLVVVVGSEGRGLSRLVGETCDLTVSIPMISEVESLNASVAAAVTLAEVARRRSVEL